MVFYPLPHRDVVFSTSSDYGVDPYLVFAIIRAESKYQTTAESPQGAKGLMQIMPETAALIAQQIGQQEFSTEDLHDPQTNIRFGCWYINNLKKEYNDNLPLTIAAYNAGRGTVQDWRNKNIWSGGVEDLDAIPFPETREYVKNVLKNYEAYQAIYK